MPAWDGSARSWRRYTREVSWFVRSTPYHKRRYCATKLVSRLSGPARLLAMSWRNADFDHVGGTKLYLQRLASSPLVRQSLPNAAAICQQYFAFRRQPGEAMHAFLVREALGYSEFIEALERLKDDKMGIEQHEKDLRSMSPTRRIWVRINLILMMMMMIAETVLVLLPHLHPDLRLVIPMDQLAPLFDLHRDPLQVGILPQLVRMALDSPWQTPLCLEYFVGFDCYRRRD